MSLFFYSPSWIVSSLLIVGVVTLLCVTIFWIVRKTIPASALRKNHDVAGFTFSIIGVLYSVILGFTVINVHARYNDAVDIIHTESTLLADLYRDAGFFDSVGRDAIRKMLRAYTHFVIEEEWGSLIEVTGARCKRQKLMHQLWDTYYKVDLENKKMEMFYEQSIIKLDSLMNKHLARELSSSERLSNMMWSLLIIGGIITIGFMFFFGLENIRTQMLMTALLAGYISFMLYLIFSLDHIFKGSEGIPPTAFEQTFVLFDCWDRGM